MPLGRYFCTNVSANVSIFVTSTKSITLPPAYFYATAVYLGTDLDLDCEDRGLRLDDVVVGRFGLSTGSCQLPSSWMPDNNINTQ